MVQLLRAAYSPASREGTESEDDNIYTATESIELTTTTELGLSMFSVAKSCKMYTDGDKTRRTTAAWMEDHNFLVGSEDGLFQKFHARFADKSTTGSQAADTSLPHTQCHAISRIALTPSPHNWIGTASNDCTVAVSKYVVNFTNTLNVDRSHKNFVQGAPWHLFNSSLYSCSQFSTVPERDITDSDDMKDRIKDYLKKRDCGVLLCEKRRGVSDLVTSKVELSTTRDGKVHFGDRVLLINPEPADKSCPLHALTLTWTDLFLHDLEEIACAQFGKVAATSCNISPNYRNVFTVTSCDGSHDGEPLRYNQPFYLTAANGRMYLTSDRFDFQRLTKYSRQPQVTVEFLHYLAVWNVLPFDPCIRPDTPLYRRIPKS